MDQLVYSIKPNVFSRIVQQTRKETKKYRRGGDANSRPLTGAISPNDRGAEKTAVENDAENRRRTSEFEKAKKMFSFSSPNTTAKSLKSDDDVELESAANSFENYSPLIERSNSVSIVHAYCFNCRICGRPIQTEQLFFAIKIARIFARSKSGRDENGDDAKLLTFCADHARVDFLLLSKLADVQRERSTQISHVNCRSKSSSNSRKKKHGDRDVEKEPDGNFEGADDNNEKTSMGRRAIESNLSDNNQLIEDDVSAEIASRFDVDSNQQISTRYFAKDEPLECGFKLSERSRSRLTPQTRFEKFNKQKEVISTNDAIVDDASARAKNDVTVYEVNDDDEDAGDGGGDVEAAKKQAQKATRVRTQGRQSNGDKGDKGAFALCLFQQGGGKGGK